MERTLIEVAKIHDLPIQVGKEVNVRGREIALFRLTNGKVKAVENKCPHKEGPLSQGLVSGEFVFCPLHDWKIDLDNGLVQKPDDGCVQTFEIKVIDDTVFIRI